MFKVGDVVECLNDWEGQFTKGKEYKVVSAGPYIVKVEADDNGSPNGWWNACFRLAEPSKSPVRTATRREIVPGTYGKVRITEGRYVHCNSMRTSEELREAAHLFNQLAEVLEENE